ncbi:MAG: hypothetical protein HZB80_05625 [Deltaproteobacteria bacterium]|nr:hypothetical protein [Deltaproteobacteria bacterium]
MDTPRISSALQGIGTKTRGIKDLTIVDYAFMLMRGIVITCGFFWLVLHPYPDTLKLWIIIPFLIFITYSIIAHGLILIWPQKIETIYFACLSLDLIFIGIFIKLSGGFNSILFLIIYPPIVIHSFYYGFYRGIALSAVASIVYVIAVYDQWWLLQWTDMAFRIFIMFLIAGFMGFISERAKHDRDELIITQRRLEFLQKELEKAYKNLQDVKSQVEQSEKLASIGRLSAELAHEINNPLDGIKNCLAVIKTETEDTELKKKYFELIDEALYDIECAVRNLLGYAKRHVPVWEEVDINGVLERTIIMTDYKLQNTGIAVKTSFEANIPAVIGDSHQLQEVFFNIILNALDAMPKGGTLTVETSKAGNFVDIKIIDTGIGISHDDMANIFQPFYTTKLLGEGTGLGLSVSLEIVRKHDGDINVYSEQGKGAVFNITLPAAIKASAPC